MWQYLTFSKLIEKTRGTITFRIDSWLSMLVAVAFDDGAESFIIFLPIVQFNFRVQFVYNK